MIEIREWITRIELIDNGGRRYVGHNVVVEESIQDGGRTLKIFVNKPIKSKDYPFTHTAE